MSPRQTIKKQVQKLSDSKQLILVDGSSYLFRAFHALPPLVNSKGQPTGAVKGVINMIRALIKGHPESNIAIVFDAKGKTFRSDMYAEYKAHRPPMPDELRSQIEPIHRIVEAMGLPMLIITGVEADDVIGTLAGHASKQNIKTLISTGDKDLAQLVNDDVTLMNTMTNELLDHEGVVKKFGVKPDQIIDYLGLVGDKVDNIPGVPSVGPKTAVKWLTEFGTMEGVIENAASVGGKVGEKLRDNIDQLRLSYELATIKMDVELEVELKDLVHSEENKPQLHELFSDLEFKSWVKELEAAGVVSTAAVPEKSTGASDDSDSNDNSAVNVVPESIDYQVITTELDLRELVSKIEKSKQLCINLEVHNDHFLDAAIFGISISLEIGKASYIPVAHVRPEPVLDLSSVSDTDSENEDENNSENKGLSENESHNQEDAQLPLDIVLNILKPLLENPGVRKTGFDLKLMKHVFANYEIDFYPIDFDVLLESYVVNSVATKHHLDEIAEYYLGLRITDLSGSLGKGKAKRTKCQLSIAEFSHYAAEKADFILRLSLVLAQSLKAQGLLEGVYRYYEKPLVEVLQLMERNGIKVDSAALNQQSKELGVQLEKLQQQVFEIAGEEFNLGSPKQLQTIFYEKLELPVLKKTKTGQPSTAEPVLQELAQDYELPRFILEHRSLSKLKSTYTDKLPKQVKGVSGRIHSTFQQAVAATGRLSSTDPNLQNIPIRTAEGRRVRQAFVSNKGYKLVAADYSQVELRIMAHLSQDAGLLRAFTSAEDVHRATAADVFGVALEEVSTEQRRGAKAINFGLIYGMSAFGLANQLKISRGDAQLYVDKYFEKYPGVRKYMDETQAWADEKGFVETLFGRRLYLPGIHAGNGMIRKAAQRTAINAPMQGTAADIIKQAMIDIGHWLRSSELDAKMVLQVHDELVFEVAEKDVELLIDGVKFRMTTAAALDVPLVVDVGVGNNWDEAH
jgi:DNA polymerase-1